MKASYIVRTSLGLEGEGGYSLLRCLHSLLLLAQSGERRRDDGKLGAGNDAPTSTQSRAVAKA